MAPGDLEGRGGERDQGGPDGRAERPTERHPDEGDKHRAGLQPDPEESSAQVYETADRDRHPDRRSVDAHRHPALTAAGELLGDEGEGDREHDRAADALQAAGNVEEGRVGGDRAEQRGDGEDPQPDDEYAPAAEPVGQRPRGEDERGEREGVGVDHPLQVGEVGVQRALDLRQRDVHDRDVEQEHERRDANRDQGPPLAVHAGQR